MRKGDATRLRLLDKAAQLAATRGITGLSLGDVASAAAISKSGLFKHFESKEAMQFAIMERELERFTEKVWRPAEPLAPGVARLSKLNVLWLDWTVAENAGRGCFIMTAAAELDDQPGPLRDLLQTGLRRWSKTLTREFQAVRTPPLPEAEAALAAFQMNAFVLGHNEARRLMDDERARATAEAAFRSLLERTMS